MIFEAHRTQIHTCHCVTLSRYSHMFLSCLFPSREVNRPLGSSSHLYFIECHDPEQENFSKTPSPYLENREDILEVTKATLRPEVTTFYLIPAENIRAFGELKGRRQVARMGDLEKTRHIC